jgi:hypothetical protein
MRSLPHQKCSPEAPRMLRNGSTVLVPEKAKPLRGDPAGRPCPAFARDALLAARSGWRSSRLDRTKEQAIRPQWKVFSLHSAKMPWGAFFDEAIRAAILIVVTQTRSSRRCRWSPGARRLPHGCRWPASWGRLLHGPHRLRPSHRLKPRPSKVQGAAPARNASTAVTSVPLCGGRKSSQKVGRPA